MLRNVSIKTRIVAIISILILVIIALVATIVVTGENIKNSGIADSQRVMLEGEKEKIKLGTHTIAQALGKALQGTPDPAGQAEIITRYINDIRFEEDNSGYYFVYQGTTVFVHPVQPKLVGSDLKNAKDVNGVYYVSELNEQARKGGGFVSFIFGKPRPDGTIVNAPKLAYVEMIPDTNLWISTGIYVDNIDAHKAAMEEHMSNALFRQLGIVIGCILAFGIFVLLPFCLYTVRSLSGPLRETTAAAEQIAGGNLNVSLAAAGNDEVTVLQRSLLRMAQNLRASFAEVQAKEGEALKQADEAQKAVSLAQNAMRKADAANAGMIAAAARLEQAVDELKGVAQNISTSTAGVKDGTSTQDSRIRNIVSVMEQQNARMLEIARRAGNAADKSEESRKKVEAGARLAKESGLAMSELRALAGDLTGNIHKLGEQSENIGKIISVINDIADQTNLLALNAAIEAARAGDAGRGFAVVADEVRKLAEKTMQATHEVHSSIVAIQELAQVNISGMDNAVTSINHVNELSSETFNALEEVQAIVMEATSQAHSIAEGVEEQSASSAEATTLVSEVSSIAAANTRLVGNAEGELHAFSGKVAELLGLVTELRNAKN